MTQLEQLKADLESMSKRIAALEAQEAPELKVGDECWFVGRTGAVLANCAESNTAHQFPYTDSGKLRAERVGKRFRAMKEPAKEPFAKGEKVWFVRINGRVNDLEWEGTNPDRLYHRLGMVHKTKAEAESWLAENRDAFWGEFGGGE